MEENVKVTRIKMPSTMMTSILLILVGLLLLIQPGHSLNTICRVLGLIVLVVGVVEVFIGFAARNTMTGNTNMIIGAIVALVGIVIVSRPDGLVSLLPFVAGVVITTHGITSLIKSVQLVGTKDKYWWVGLIFSLVSVGFGLLLVFKSYEAAEFTARIAGLFLLYSGGSHLWILYRKAKAAKIRKQEETALDVDAKIVDAE